MIDLVPLQWAPRSIGGVDFGRQSRILIREGVSLLIHTPGGPYWSSIGKQSYGCSHISFASETPYRSARTYASLRPPDGAKLPLYGRSLLKPTWVRAFAVEHFGVDAVEAWQYKHTVIVTS